jgi:hypothetical protein
MGRQRIELSPAVEAEIAARTARGESPASIWEAVGRVVSAKTIERRQSALKRGPAMQAPQPTEAASTNDIPDEVPETTPLEDLNRWIARLEIASLKAEERGNLGELASLAAKSTALMALKHRATPMAKPNPNDAPDMIALAEVGEKRLQALVDDLFRSGTP